MPWAVVLVTGRAVRLLRSSGLVDGFPALPPVFADLRSDGTADPVEEILKRCRDTRWH